MACLAPDGSLTDSGRRILASLATVSTAEEVAQATNLPTYRVRSALRELVAAGLVTQQSGGFAAAEADTSRT